MLYPRNLPVPSLGAVGIQFSVTKSHAPKPVPSVLRSFLSSSGIAGTSPMVVYSKPPVAWPGTKALGDIYCHAVGDITGEAKFKVGVVSILSSVTESIASSPLFGGPRS